MIRKSMLLTQPKEKVDLSVTYPHSPEKVWTALTDPKSLSKWLLPNDFRPEVGHRFHFQDQKRRISCEVTSVDKNRRLSYTWRDGSDEPLQVVTWTLEPIESGTRLRLEHTSASAMMMTGSAGLAWAVRLTSLLSLFETRSRVRYPGVKLRGGRLVAPSAPYLGGNRRMSRWTKVPR